MDLSRLPSISEEDIKRAAKYQDAIDYLLEDNEEFLDDMEFLDDLAFHINKRKKKSSGSLIFNRSGDYLM